MHQFPSIFKTGDFLPMPAQLHWLSHALWKLVDLVLDNGQLARLVDATMMGLFDQWLGCIHNKIIWEQGIIKQWVIGLLRGFRDGRDGAFWIIVKLSLSIFGALVRPLIDWRVRLLCGLGLSSASRDGRAFPSVVILLFWWFWPFLLGLCRNSRLGSGQETLFVLLVCTYRQAS